jgi:chemotaxis signal transduction protein
MTESAETIDQAVKAMADREGKYLTFSLADDIEATPTFGVKLNTEYILGMAKMEEGVKILLDIDRVLSSEEISALEKAA